MEVDCYEFMATPSHFRHFWKAVAADQCVPLYLQAMLVPALFFRKTPGFTPGTIRS
jgi:hypothetical protein